jgi:glycosyltransferase involved in cell wall biosynthesis
VTTRRVLLCEPYFSGSHASWATGLAEHSRHDVEILDHHGAFWKWRMQGASLTMAEEVEASVERAGRPDVVLVSDMVNVPSLLGLARGALNGVPVVLYMHENQLTYPSRGDEPADDTYAMINWLSLVAADHVIFNSAFHHRDLFEQLPSLLARLPDHRHLHRLDEVRAKSSVIPIGVEFDRFDAMRSSGERPTVLWNHRWEHDKDPEAFFAALFELAEEGLPFDVIVAGERFATTPPVFEAARARLGDRIVHFGTAGTDLYSKLLGQADVVVSTARHEFFGLAVAEAVAAGCLPLLPDRLSYPELVPAADPFLYRDAAHLVRRLRWALTDDEGRRTAASTARAYMQGFDWRGVAPRYDELLDQVAASAR